MSILDRFRIDGRAAIVTGASAGLGVAIAVGLAEAGADVVLAARRVDGLEATRARVEAAGRRAVVVPTDVAVVEDCDRLVDTAMRELGRVDILVNNAGVAGAAPATREDPDHFRRILDVNLHGTYWTTKACGRVMRPGSSVVNISSMLGFITGGLPQAAYATSKAGLLGLTRDLAGQWTGRKGIRVNAIAPGWFHSEMIEQYEPGYLEERMHRILAGRIGDPEELAAAVLFLASDASSYMTGQVIIYDGGVCIS